MDKKIKSTKKHKTFLSEMNVQVGGEDSCVKNHGGFSQPVNWKPESCSEKTRKFSVLRNSLGLK